MSGPRRQFDRALEAIDATVTELFAVDLPGASQALPGGHVAGALADRQHVIDALYREVEELASRELLLRAPVASDLRFLLSPRDG